MTQQDLHPPRLDWRSLDEKDRLIWAAAFVAGERAEAVGAEVADAMIEKLCATETRAEASSAVAVDPNGEPPLQRVFDAFFRGIESTKRAKPGADLPLKPVHEALECDLQLYLS